MLGSVTLLNIYSRFQRLARRGLHSLQTQRWQWVVGLLAFLTVNGYIAYRLYREWDQISAFNWSQVDITYLVIAAGIQFVGLLVAVFAWGYALNQYGHTISFRRHFKIYTVANLARKLPGGIGVDLLSKVYMYDRDGGDRVRVSFLTLAEPLIIGVAATIVALVTMVISGGTLSYVNPLIPLGIVTLFLVLLPSPIIKLLLARVSRIPPEQQQLRWHHLLNWTVLNSLTITLGGITLFLFCRAFGVVEQQAFALIVQAWAVVAFSSILLIWLPIDVGVAASIMVLTLATFMAMPQAILLLVAWRVWTTFVEITWGTIGFLL